MNLPMDLTEFDELCLQMPGARREYPFGPQAAVYKVGAKMFALASEGSDPLRVNLKCEPHLAEALREEYPDAVLPGYHMNKRHWNTVVLDGTLDRDLVVDLVQDSYDLVAPSRRPG